MLNPKKEQNITSMYLHLVLETKITKVKKINLLGN